MFTGIIESVATVKSSRRENGSLVLSFAKPKGWRLRAGDSVATDGVCLTVEKVGRVQYQCRLMPETLSKTTFGVADRSRVNVERSLLMNGRLDGHLVTGHVDALGQIVALRKSGDAWIVQIRFPKEFRRLVAEKGSIAVDGVSLTVVDVVGDSFTNTPEREVLSPKDSRASRLVCWFTVSLVRYTLEHTTLIDKVVGDLVNLEFDILAKYIAAQHR